MKSSKNQQRGGYLERTERKTQKYGNSERADRRSSKQRGEKGPALDRKSSRGMIYENEELRLRTININAEVERGQSDIKRLRRENEHLRREIWTLRDECDRLNKRVKAKLSDYEHSSGGCGSARASGCTVRGGGSGAGGCDGYHSHSNSDDSDSCETCKDAGDDRCSDDDCCQNGSCNNSNNNQNTSSSSSNRQLQIQTQMESQSQPTQSSSCATSTTGCTIDEGVPMTTISNDLTQPHPHLPTFDHLSVVSEETMSNIEAAASQADQQHLASLVRPMTPIEMLANELHDLQSVVPPLSYFENVVHQHMGSNIGHTPETAATSTSSANQMAACHTNGWDYQMQSPFAHGKYNALPSSSSSSPLSAATAIAVSPVQYTQSPQTPLTTFGHTGGGSQAPTDTTQCKTPILSLAGIETVPITTMPTNVPTTANSPKHFFSPLKPRLKINTALANKSMTQLTAVAPPVVPPPSIPTPPLSTAATAGSDDRSLSSFGTELRNCDPPDIFVANALASPYQRQPLPAHQIGGGIVVAMNSAPPIPTPSSISSSSLPQRNSSSPQVSPRHQHQHYSPQSLHGQHQLCYQQQQKQHEVKQRHQHYRHHHQHQQGQQRTQQQHIAVVNVVVDDNDDYNDDVVAAADNKADIGVNNTINCQQMQFVANYKPMPKPQPPSMVPQHCLLPVAAGAAAPTATIHVQMTNTLFTKINEPIYATAQKCCNHLISAVAVTKPLMTATTNTTRGRSIKPASISALGVLRRPSLPPPPPTICITRDCQIQTDSVNLEAILNDIETISEDILAIQLDKNRSRENIPTTAGRGHNRRLDLDDKNKKPYRSEMNLFLSYDGANTTITPAEGTTRTSAAGAVGTQTSMQGDLMGSHSRRTRSLEREHTDSPSPHIPDPMAPFPYNRTYLGFDQLNKCAAAPSHLQQKSPPTIGTKPAIAAKPSPPTRLYSPQLSIRCAGVARSNPLLPTPSTPPSPQQQHQQTPTSQNITAGCSVLSPNKSHLYAALANAAAKRAQFRAAPSHLTKSLDMGLMTDDENGLASPAESTQAADAAKRKARHVSIICGDSATPTSPGEMGSHHQPRSCQAQTTTFTLTQPSSGSCSDLPSALTNPALRGLITQAHSHSTPNSPHSSRRRSNSNCNTPDTPATSIVATTTTATPTTTSTHANNHSHHLHRKASQDSIRGGGGNCAELAAAAALVARSKCSRRHSDGTVPTNTQQRVSGNNGGVTGGGGGGHHHHHHHHHQHTASMLSTTNPHHSHHSHQDSNHETGTSMSDRNSNSFPSSRESSTNFSLRSTRRKISVSSHTGGKIPWCGCWGNGCL